MVFLLGGGTALGQRSGVPSGLRPSSIVTLRLKSIYLSRGLNYPCRTPARPKGDCVIAGECIRAATFLSEKFPTGYIFIEFLSF
jgi:hypothetical protein